MMAGFCAACGAARSASARFCAGCGREHGAASRAEDARFEGPRAVRAIALVFVGTLGGLALLHFALAERGPSAALAQRALLAAVGFGAAALLGRDGFVTSLGGTARPRWIAAGLALGPLVFALNLAYVLALRALAPGAAPELPAGDLHQVPLALRVLDVAVLVPLLEEWLCRGVLWAACLGVLGPRWTLVATAALFALLHGLGPGLALELPHRFATGLALGWLRLKSGSLAPAILAHAVNNLLALLSGG